MSTEGWLFLARPLLSVLVVAMAALAWRADRLASRRPNPSETPVPLAPGWYVEVLEPGLAHSIHKGMRIPVPGVLTLGRAPENAVVIEDPAVSASHARLCCDAQGCTVEDLGSRNGTLVDESLLAGQRAVADGTLIRVGDAMLGVRHVV
ncbi:MAG: FHA domain-containing protein [Armatimonadetes bacterium]|nr:FHA domain-containing protein [Armatimonadota bacterium]